MDFTRSDLQVQISQYRCRIVFTEIADLQTKLLIQVCWRYQLHCSGAISHLYITRDHF